MSSINKRSDGSKLKSSKPLPMIFGPSCASLMADKKCRQLRSLIVGHCNQRSRAAAVQATTAQNAGKVIKFIWRSIHSDIYSLCLYLQRMNKTLHTLRSLRNGCKPRPAKRLKSPLSIKAIPAKTLQMQPPSTESDSKSLNYRRRREVLF